MLSAADRLAAEVGNDVSACSKSKRAPVSGEFRIFDEANRIDTLAVLDRLGIAHADSNRGTMAICPGCGEDGALVCKDGGLKCLHDRCAQAGPVANPGFRTNVDLVMHVEQIDKVAAAKQICEWFSIAVSRGTKKTTAESWEPRDSDAPDATPADAQSGQRAEQKPKSTFHIRSAAELFGPLETPDYLIDGIIRRGGLLEIQAYGGSGKSWLAVNLALSVATGTPWLGRFPTKLGSVLSLDYENGFYEEARRFQANAKALGLPTPVVGVSVSCMPECYMTSDNFEAEIKKLAAQYQLIIIDTLKAASPGTDENDSKTREPLDKLRRVGELTSCTFVVLIHSKKKSNSQTEIDPREQGRGSSAIFDACDAQLGVTYQGDGEPLLVVQTKARSGKTVAPFEVRIVDTAVDAVAIVASDSKSQEASHSARFEDVCNQVVAAVKANRGCSARFLRTPVKSNPNTIKDALEYLERNGVLTERQIGESKKLGWYFCGNSDREER